MKWVSVYRPVQCHFCEIGKQVVSLDAVRIRLRYFYYNTNTLTNTTTELGAGIELYQICAHRLLDHSRVRSDPSDLYCLHVHVLKYLIHMVNFEAAMVNHG